MSFLGVRTKLGEGLTVSKFTYQLYLSSLYRAAELLMPVALALILIHYNTSILLAVPLAVTGMVIFSALPEIWNKIDHNNQSKTRMAYIVDDTLFLHLEDTIRIDLKRLDGIIISHTFWPGLRNKIVFIEGETQKTVKTKIDYVPLFKLLSEFDQELRARPKS